MKKVVTRNYGRGAFSPKFYLPHIQPGTSNNDTTTEHSNVYTHYPTSPGWVIPFFLLLALLAPSLVDYLLGGLGL